MANNVRLINGWVSVRNTVTAKPKDLTEIPVGEYWIRGKSLYKVVPAERNGNCMGCDLLDKNGICTKHSDSHPCTAYRRSDKTWIIYKKVNK